MRLLNIAGLCLLAGCSDAVVQGVDSEVDGSGPGTDSGTGQPGTQSEGELTITTAAAEVRIGDEALPIRVELVVSGGSMDVSGESVFVVVPATAGRVSAGAFIPGPTPGAAIVRARYEGLEAEAALAVLPGRQVAQVEVPGEPAVPEEAPALFEAATVSSDASDVPLLVYPNDGVLLPRNLGQLEIHYRPRGASLFKVVFAHPSYELEVYTRCASLRDGCVFALDEALYSTISEATAGQAPVRVKVTGLDEGREVRADSATIEFSLSADPVQGALYYWTTSREAIMRVDFGAGNEPEQFFPFGGSDRCYGCHALSPDGTRMTLSRDGINRGELFLLDVASRTIELDGVQTGDREQFQTWAPDSSRFAAIYGDDDPTSTQIRIRSGETGAVLEDIELGHEPSHPNWSPAGDRIAYTRVTRHASSQRPGRGGISYVEALPGGGWSAPQTVVEPEDGFNYYNPAYAPDGSFLLYNMSRCSDGIYSSECNADSDPSAQIWAYSDAGRVRMSRADGRGVEDDTDALSNTFPRWAPFEGRAFDGGRVYWMTFSSTREYGLRSPPGSGTLMWMAAVDPDAVARGEDGSFPAFALPFQDLTTSNHIGQWTEVFVPVEPDPGGGTADPCRDVGESCGPEACCGGLICSAGSCIFNN